MSTTAPHHSYGASGGFLPSPAPTTTSVDTSSAYRLPKPRSRPLVAGSHKEEYARNYITARLLYISRRFAKRVDPYAVPYDPEPGYTSFTQVAADLDELVDLIWFTATPTLQIPPLLIIADNVREYLPCFEPPSPVATFALLRKLDHVFANRLVAQLPHSGQSGVSYSRPAMTKTDMVRCKSLVEETRLVVAEKMSGEPDVETYLPEDEVEETAVVQSVGKRPRVEDDWDVEILADDNNDDNDDDDDVYDLEESDDDDTDMKIEDEPPIKPHQNHGTPPRRIKTESPEAEEQLRSVTSPSTCRPLPDHHGTAGTDAKFHFTLDEADSSDSETEPNTKSVVRQQHTPSSASSSVHLSQTTIATSSAQYGEEEELQMNVAQVYEKTILQLGKALGPSIGDEGSPNICTFMPMDTD